MPQGRRSRLTIRRVDPWTILKFSVLLYASMYFVIIVAGLVLWAAATGSGVRGNIESFIGELIASEDFSFNPDQILRSSVIGGAILVVLGSLANVLMAVLYNLISDVVGGIGISVEERPPRRRSLSRRPRPRPVAGNHQGDGAPRARPPQRPAPTSRPPGGQADLGG
ncbi:MAG: DUF3566 domain-containing protein [Actinomycetota bacterium]